MTHKYKKLTKKQIKELSPDIAADVLYCQASKNKNSNEDVIVNEKKGDQIRTVKISKGWTVETIKDKNSQSVIAKKKFFRPGHGGFSSGEITYSVFKSNKSKSTDNIDTDL